MLFNNKSKYKRNYLIAVIGNKLRKTYERYEYEIYDTLNGYYEYKGSLSSDDVQLAVCEFRKHIADEVFDAIDREYPDSLALEQQMLAEFTLNNTDDILITGPSIAVVYSIACKTVLGDEFDFHVLEAATVAYDELEDATFEQLASTMLSKFEQYEATTVRKSLEILVEDGRFGSYPDYR